MTREKPKVRLHVEFRAGQPPPMFPTLLRDFADSLKHQHRRQRQLWPTGKHFAATTGEQVLKFKARFFLHSDSVLTAGGRGLIWVHSLTHAMGRAKLRPADPR